MKPSKDAIARLRVVQKQILQSPEFYDQDDFGTYTPCGTICCIAGWVHYNEVGATKHNELVRANWLSISRLATNILGLDGFPNLFAQNGAWPEPFSSEYDEATTPLARAKVAVRRIDHYIETGE